MTSKTVRAIAPSQIPKAVARGVATSILIMVGGAALMSVLILREIIKETAVGYCAMGILLLSSMEGTRAAVRKSEGKIFTVAVLTGAVYAGILLILNAMLYKGGYEGVGVSVLLIIGGSIASGFLTIPDRRIKKHPKRKKKHR